VRPGGLVYLAVWLLLVLAAPRPAGATSRAESPGLFAGGQALPVVASEARIAVRGPFAEVVITQRFKNDLDRGVEAIYVFPLPDDAAVRSMVIRTGDETITAAIERREEARKAYEAAVAGGVAAGLTEQERANVFTQQVSGIAPGAEVSVELRFDMGLGRWRDGWELALPLVVAPRHVPGAATGRPASGAGSAPDTERVGDASRVTPPVRERGGNPIDVTIDLGDVPKSAVDVPSHEAKVTRRKGHTIVTVADARSDRDLVVRWRGDPDGGATALAEKSGDGGVIALVIEAPRKPAAKRAARRWVLVLDTSGSMDGDALQILKDAARALLGAVGEDPVAIVAPGATELRWRKGADGRALANPAIDRLRASGATALDTLLDAGLAGARDDADTAIVVVTDGLIADDAQVAARIDGAAARVHAVGVGSAPNRWFLDQLARRGRGVATVIAAGDDAAKAIADLVAAARAPAVTPQIDWGGLTVKDVTPATLPALAAGRAVVVAARVDRLTDATIRARLGDARSIAAVRAGAAGKGGLVARRWARLRVDELLAAPPADVVAQVTRLGLDHGLVTPYTALVARGARVTVQGGVRTSVAIPVAMPAGMRWQAVFGPRGDVGAELATTPSPTGGKAEGAVDDRALEQAPAATEATEESLDYGETIMVHGRVYSSRPWTASLGATVGFYLRDGAASTQGALTGTALRRVARDWRVGVAAKLQVADTDGGVDAAAYLNLRTYVMGGLPLFTFDLGVGPSLDTPGIGWRFGARLGPWRFAPALTVDQTYTTPDGADDDWSSRTSVGVGVDWSF